MLYEVKLVWILIEFEVLQEWALQWTEAWRILSSGPALRPDAVFRKPESRDPHVLHVI